MGEQNHDLGIVKDFHKDSVLREFVPEFARLSMSWVHLDPGQELSVHTHPTKSMIIVTDGQGRCLGVTNATITAGDVIVVPPDTQHGFIGEGQNGFWALSIQFEGEGIYEEPNAPRVNFNTSKSPIDKVREANRKYMEEFNKSPLVELVRACFREDDQETRERILTHLQPWSDDFQRIITERVASEKDAPLQALAFEHMREELGHNKLLEKSRNAGQTERSWDPVIAAVAAWFLDRMKSASSVERTVLSHLVLEGSGLIFHTSGNFSFPDNEYFSLHDSADVEHLEMGYQALNERNDWTMAQVSEVLHQGWKMMTLLCDRIAFLAQSQ
ncbi:cupin domain-containing protein [Streptomyces collinus]|uniref:cupin domain-containing protein n=1 Tax=Streptomyces collinus TaxID=42684 RepID=UPI0036BAD340